MDTERSDQDNITLAYEVFILLNVYFYAKNDNCFKQVAR
jgi:hypothetical protein